jgi:hypothetical protein
MLFLLQLALGFAFLGLLILVIWDAIRGTLIILTGLALLAIGYTLKAISFIVKCIRPIPVKTVAATPRVRSWKIVAP